MSSQIPSVAYIPSGIKKRSKFDLSNDNITTSDFFRIKPSRIIECCPRESFKLKTETLIRMYPLAVPTFGRVNHYMRWFWVPARSLMRGWNEFISQTPFYDAVSGSTSVLSSVPIFKNSDVVQLFGKSATQAGPLYQVLAKTTIGTADAVIASAPTGTPPTWTTTSIVFTKLGRAFIDTLQNLGYNINWSVADETEYSALPLLSYMRVIADYYLNPQYVNQAQVFFNMSSGDNLFYYIDTNFATFMHFFPGFSNYDPDYFVSAWDNPIAPNTVNSNPQIDIDDITKASVSGKFSVVTNNISSSPNQTPSVIGFNSGSITDTPLYLTDYIVKSLRVVTNYAIRNNVAGYKFWDRLEAEYGSVMDYKEKGTSLYIDTQVTNVQISPVVSQSDTQGAELGALGGYGLGASTMKEIDFETKDEFGFLIGMSSIIPSIGYYQGTKRENTHITPLQFFRPDFDSQGVQALRIGEVMASQFNGDSYNTEVYQNLTPIGQNDIFAFTPRYSEYKVATDTLSGDFRVYSKTSQGSVNSYHLLREVANEFDFATDGYDVKHDPNFAHGDNTQYDRIFANPDSGETDHFILIHHHEVHAWRNMKSMAETIFDDEDLEHNEKVEVQYNGSQLN